MPSSVFFRHTAIACVSACLAMPAAFAAELGEISVQSFIGQPLSADIELTALAPDELQGIPVRLASGDVYQGGGIGMDAALQTLAISQVERGGRRFVHVGTRQAISAGHVHLYLVLGGGSQSNVRLATVWLTPAPPAPAPMPAAAPAAAPVPAPKAPDAAVLAARARAEGMVRPPAAFVASPVAKPVPAPVAPRPALPSPLRRAPAPAPVAACAPQTAGMPAEACVALDRQNVALNDKIGELEGKVAVLQKALAAPAAAAPVASGPPHAKARATAAADRKAGGNGLLWLGLGTLLFLLLTAAVVYFLRKRKQQASADARPPSKYWVLLRKPFRRKPKPVVAEPVADADSAGPPPEPEPEPFSR